MEISVNQQIITYDEAGAGLPVIFIHGYPLDRSIWAAQISGLADAAHVISLDLPGHGGSQPAAEPTTMEFFAARVAAFLDAKKIDRPVVLCGLSMGGYVSMAFARLYPQRLAGLIFTATRAAPDSEEARQNRTKSIETVQKEGSAPVVSGMLPKLVSPATPQQQPALVDAIKHIMQGVPPATVMADLAGLRDRSDSRPTLKELHLPVCFIHGADDQIIPPKEAEEMHAMVPGSTLEIIPAAGHLLNMEQPEQFNSIVRKFLLTLR